MWVVGEMLVVDTVARIRRAHFAQGKRIKGIKEIARELGVARNTVQAAGDGENTATQSRNLSPGQVNRPDLAAHGCPESPQPRPRRMGSTGACTAPGFLDNRFHHAARLTVWSCQGARMASGLRCPFFSISHSAL